MFCTENYHVLIQFSNKKERETTILGQIKYLVMYCFYNPGMSMKHFLENKTCIEKSYIELVKTVKLVI